MPAAPLARRNAYLEAAPPMAAHEVLEAHGGFLVSSDVLGGPLAAASASASASASAHSSAVPDGVSRRRRSVLRCLPVRDSRCGEALSPMTSPIGTPRWSLRHREPGFSDKREQQHYEGRHLDLDDPFLRPSAACGGGGWSGGGALSSSMPSRSRPSAADPDPTARIMRVFSDDLKSRGEPVGSRTMDWGVEDVKLSGRIGRLARDPFGGPYSDFLEAATWAAEG